MGFFFYLTSCSTSLFNYLDDFKIYIITTNTYVTDTGRSLGHRVYGKNRIIYYSLTCPYIREKKRNAKMLMDIIVIIVIICEGVNLFKINVYMHIQKDSYWKCRSKIVSIWMYIKQYIYPYLLFLYLIKCTCMLKIYPK